MTTNDTSNGYDSVAERFIEARARRSPIGVAQVRRWARDLPAGAAILDVGCGHGVPISQTLIDEGFAVYAVDASPRMIAAFRDRFPCVPAVCESAEESGFFGLTFDAALAWGLIFLLPEDSQPGLIARVARALRPGGRFLFTAPRETGSWQDVLTGITSHSLGDAAYRAAIADAGLVFIGEDIDEGDNHYYLTERPGISE